MSVLAELDTSLQALLALKSPGITKSRIATIQTLCVENVKSESILVQKIFTHFKRAPSTHKLGVLYVVDAVTRQWIDKAGLNGQDLSTKPAQDGTFVAGVHSMTELLPVMMADLISTAPYDQKEKIGKLVDIWERGNIFPSDMVKMFKAKLQSRQPDSVPGNAQTSDAAQTGAQGIKSPNEVLSDLSNITQTRNLNTNAAAPQSYTNGSSSAGQFTPGTSTSSTHLRSATGRDLPPSVATQPTPATPAVPQLTPDQKQSLAAFIPAYVMDDPPSLAVHLQLLQELAKHHIPTDQWSAAFEALRQQQQGHQPSQAQPTAPPPQLLPLQQQPMAYPTSQYMPQQQIPNYTPQQPAQGLPQGWDQKVRSRSRSPVQRRASPVYGEYQGNSNLYRQRSPLQGMNTGPTSGGTKWTDHDPTLAEGTIRVLSRTLFIGGTQCTEDQLRVIFENYGEVQSCISNAEKRHAFVKYTRRDGAVRAKDSLAEVSDPVILAKFRSVKWGVGFGPRDCNDYTTGVSVIPIDRLTEADKKWVLTAPFGGSGGRALVTGLVIEEPDIEIGAGVSSKAISRRVAGAETSRPRGQQQNQQQQYQQQQSRRPDNNQQRPQDLAQAGQFYGLPPQQMGFYGFPPANGGNAYFG